MDHNVRILDTEFSIHRLEPGSPIPESVLESHVYWTGRTKEELSIVCDSALNVPSNRCNAGWSCIEIVGPMDFAETGILSSLVTPLAAAEISVFALSTFNTDYVLVKTDTLESAVKLLADSGWHFHK